MGAPLILLGRVAEALAAVLDMILSFYLLLIIGSVLVSWVSADPRNPLVRFLYSVTEPVLRHVRRLLPFVVIGSVDFSPLVIVVAIQVIKTVVVGSLLDVALRLRMGSYAG